MEAANEIITRLGLRAHPEGGWYAETFRDAAGPDGRARCTAIHFLLAAGERSHWHRVDAVEIWLWHAGAPLALSISADAPAQTVTLGGDVAAGESPQAVVPAHA
ncbi:MAG: cupin domain-containing protein, partial [Hyphomonadaceae bacterium]